MTTSVVVRAGLLAGVCALAPYPPALLGAQDSRPANQEEAVPRSNFWAFSLWGSQLWESNVRFVQPNDSGDFVSRTGATLRQTWQSERGRMAIALSGDLSHFRKETDLNQASYRLEGTAARRLTRRLDGQLSYTFSSAQSRELTFTGAVTGVLLPFVRSRVHAGAAGATYRISRTLEVQTDSRYADVRFDSPALEGGWSAAERLSFNWLTSRVGTFSTSYEYGRDNSGGQDGDVQTLAATWRRQLMRRVDIRVDAGGVRLRQLGNSSGHATIAPVAGVTLRRESPNDVLSLRAERSASQAFGFGRLLVNSLAGATYHRNLTPLLSVGMRGRYAHNADPAGAFRITSQQYDLDVRYLLTRHLNLVGGPFLRRQDQGIVINGRGVAVMMTYDRALR